MIRAFGSGALVDLPERSVIIAGLSFWDMSGCVEIQEPRLVAILSSVLQTGILQLFSPPAHDDTIGTPKHGVGAFIFPNWFVTQDTDTSSSVRRQRLIGIDATENNGLQFRDPVDGKKKNLTPVWFVAACQKGHTHDIDWREFVHREKTDCRRTLWIEERGTSGEISETYVVCDCKKTRSLLDATIIGSHPLGFCKGTRPWLGPRQSEFCNEPARLLIRSASNAYFAETISVISLPDLDDTVSSGLDLVWNYIKDAKTINDLEKLREFHVEVKNAFEGLSDKKVLAAIEQRRIRASKDVPVKEAEFDILCCGGSVIGTDTPDSVFYAETLDRSYWDAENDIDLSYIKNLVLIHRLREVIAQVGFTRFEPPAPEVNGAIDLKVERQLLDQDVNWLPAIENRGEGIFIQIEASAVDDWLMRQEVIERIEVLSEGFNLWNEDRRSDRVFPGGAYVMLHTLSHLLITTIALECGYPASSLRERVYSFPHKSQYGILILTGSTDADGTLGGLVQQGKRIKSHLKRAIEFANLCSNDPVCAEHNAKDKHERRYLHGAACHGCLLIAETSCEHRNDLLDRALVVRTCSTSNAAFFPSGRVPI